MPATPDRGPSTLGRLALVFVSPRAAFRGLDASPSLAAPFAALVIAGGAWAWDLHRRALPGRPPFAADLAGIAAVFAVGALVAAAVLLKLARREGSTLSFPTALSIVLLDSVPAVTLSTIVSLAFLAAVPAGAGTAACWHAARTSLAGWLPADAPLGALEAARAIDVLQLWTAALSIIGLETAAGLDRRRAVKVTLVHQGLILAGRLTCLAPALFHR